MRDPYNFLSQSKKKRPKVLKKTSLRQLKKIDSAQNYVFEKENDVQSLSFCLSKTKFVFLRNFLKSNFLVSKLFLIIFFRIFSGTI